MSKNLCGGSSEDEPLFKIKSKAENRIAEGAKSENTGRSESSEDETLAQKLKAKNKNKTSIGIDSKCMTSGDVKSVVDSEGSEDETLANKIKVKKKTKLSSNKGRTVDKDSENELSETEMQTEAQNGHESNSEDSSDDCSDSVKITQLKKTTSAKSIEVNGLSSHEVSSENDDETERTKPEQKVTSQEVVNKKRKYYSSPTKVASSQKSKKIRKCSTSSVDTSDSDTNSENEHSLNKSESRKTNNKSPRQKEKCDKLMGKAIGAKSDGDSKVQSKKGKSKYNPQSSTANPDPTSEVPTQSAKSKNNKAEKLHQLSSSDASDEEDNVNVTVELKRSTPTLSGAHLKRSNSDKRTHGKLKMDKNTKGSDKKNIKRSENNNNGKIERNYQLAKDKCKKEASASSSSSEVEESEAEETTAKKCSKGTNVKKKVNYQERALARLKRLVREMGLRVNNYEKFFGGCKSFSAKKRKLMAFMQENGLVGNPTIQSCRKAKEKNENKKEMECIDLGNIITDSGRGRRNVFSVYAKPVDNTDFTTSKKKKQRTVTRFSDSESESEDKRDSESDREDENDRQPKGKIYSSDSDCEVETRNNRAHPDSDESNGSVGAGRNSFELGDDASNKQKGEALPDTTGPEKLIMPNSPSSKGSDQEDNSFSSEDDERSGVK